MPKMLNEIDPFTFTVIAHPSFVPTSGKRAAYLLEDNWDDWNLFRTLFKLIVFDEEGIRHDVGYVKIGQFGLKGARIFSEGFRLPSIPNQFRKLDEAFFSLGQDDSYYLGLVKLSENLRERLLNGLRDVAVDDVLWKRALEEEVTRISLLRSVKPKNVEGQFRRLASGGTRLTAYKLTYTPQKQAGASEPPDTLSFHVEPDSYPPTNIHVLIGRNGVGKTHMLHSMTKALVSERSASRRYGRFGAESIDNESPPIANLVSVSFSAFDDFELLPEKRDRAKGLQYSYIGLRRTSDTGKGRGTPKSTDILAREFVKSVKTCMQGARVTRWRKALKSLNADPLFREADVTAISNHVGDVEEFEQYAASVFEGLSSGHKIVLLTITRLVETVEEQTLVLLDEPEAHLHPPLLSAFVRALSDLMINRNGVAIIATHSPVVLQEVPKSCVWKLFRTGSIARIERPENETFGENVGVLTREVFGLELTQSGFHRMLSDAVTREASYESALLHFNNELGAEARAILRALYATRDS